MTDTDIFLMVEKCIRDGISHTIRCYVKANNKCMKDYDKTEESSFGMWIIFMDGPCCRSYLYLVLTGLKKALSLMKISWKDAMKTVS